MLRNLLLQTLLLFFVLTLNVNGQSRKRKKKENKTQTEQILKPKVNPKPKKGEPQPYNKVVTKEMKTDAGLFKVHSNDDKYLFEIPDSLLNREMLMVTRIAKTASELGFGGLKTNTQVLRWQRKNNKILLRVVSHQVVADTMLPIHESVVNSNFEPLLYSFPIKAFNKDTTSVVIDVSKFMTDDIKAMGLPQSYRTRHRITRLDNSRSYIERMSSYPRNIELRHVKTYFANTPPSNGSLGSISVEMSNSMILLPKEPMKRRYFDERVGWISRGQQDYGLDAQKTKTIKYIDRWRLEVRDEDIDKFNKGELVAPKKQIVYYIDRATPEQWKKYIKQGIEDWQVAFEAAGFKEAIIAKDAPSKEEDPDWSPEDVRYSVVRYLALPIPNASGPHVSDPRSGEILESDINWFHNIMSVLGSWYFVQTAAINPEAQKTKLKTEIMGRLIRTVSAHEVGHTLGLPHNMGSSVAYPVDSLRSKTFTDKHGTAPSIMDYARFNYVAQPEDGVDSLMPKIGAYDKYAINWGYRPILQKTAEAEKPILNKWITDKAGNSMYRFGHQQVAGIVDPTSQTEDIGDDSMKASTYGVMNLKRIIENLEKWTTKEGETYEDMAAMYDQILGQFSRYIGHVSSNLGGVYEYYKAVGQDGIVYTHVPRDKQRNAIMWLNKQLFDTPNWLIDKRMIGLFNFSGHTEKISRIQSIGLNAILDSGRLSRMIENETLNGKKAYKISTLFYDMRQGIWSEIYKGTTIDAYRRKLQRAHVNRLEYLLNKAKNQRGVNSEYLKISAVNTDLSDIKAMIRGELNKLKRDINNNISKTSSQTTRYHLQDIIARINVTLEN